MALKDFFFKASAITEQAELNAAYISSVPVESPWADGTGLDVITAASLYPGIAPENLPVNRSVAMSVASVAKGRKVIVDSIARMPLIALRNGDPIPNQPTLLTQLEPGISNFVTMSWTLDSLIFFGRAFWLITARTADGRPASIRYVPESQLELKDGILVKAFGKNVRPQDSIRFDSNNEGFLNFGQGVIREALEIEHAAREAGATPVPAMIFKQTGGPEMSRENIAGMINGWVANRRKKNGSIAFLSENIEAHSIGQTSENLLIDARNYAAIQVARAMGVPAWCVEATVAGTSLSYSNMASRNREVLDALTGLITVVEETLSLYFPSTTVVKFDTTELLKADTKERYDAYKVGLDAGFLTINEVRDRENMEPLPDEEQVAPETPAEPLPTPEEPS